MDPGLHGVPVHAVVAKDLKVEPVHVRMGLCVKETQLSNNNVITVHVQPRLHRRPLPLATTAVAAGVEAT
jgi:hypothetical protein